jgi:DNA-directed RNA polymerase specialized sigma24 family protein
MAEECSFAELMARLRGNDQDAATQLFHQYVHRLIGLARHHLHERVRRKVGDEAVVQSALCSFFVSHTADANLHSADSLWTRLVEITLRHCGKWNKRFRAQKRNRPEVSLQPATGEGEGCIDPPGDEPGPEEGAALADELQNLRATLNDRQAQVLQGLLRGDTVTEISRQMCLSEALVYRLRQQLRDKVRARLEQLGACAGG